MEENKNKYSIAFTSGALLFKECDAVITRLDDYEGFLKGTVDLDLNWIPTNAESSKKRLKTEITKRLRALEKPEYFQLYSIVTTINKKLILFYANCKTYPIIVDFMAEVVLNKWYNLDLELTAYDFLSFLYKKMDTHPELMEISENSQKKISQVMMRMLSEITILQEGKLQKVEFDPTILQQIQRDGDGWFLEIIFLNEIEREQFSNNL